MTGVYVKAALAVLGLQVLAGCNVIVGDSIMNMSRSNVSAHLTNMIVNAADGRGAYNAGLNGEPGTGLEAITSSARDTVKAGEWMVVEIGTNNLSFTADQRAWFIMQVVGAVSDDKCLAWVTPYAEGLPSEVAGWVSSLQTYLPNQPCNALVRWDLEAAGHSEYFVDGVHPTEAGKEVLVCLIGSAIGQPC